MSGNLQKKKYWKRGDQGLWRKSGCQETNLPTNFITKSMKKKLEKIFAKNQ